MNCMMYKKLHMPIDLLLNVPNIGNSILCSSTVTMYVTPTELFTEFCGDGAREATKRKKES